MFDYNTKCWKKKRAYILWRDGYIDRVQRRFGRTIEADTVHHIYPAEEYPEFAFEDWNLISVNSKVTHNKCHNRLSNKLTPFGESLKKIADNKKLQSQKNEPPPIDEKNCVREIPKGVGEFPPAAKFQTFKIGGESKCGNENLKLLN